MRNWRANFASFDRTRVQGVRSGRLTHDRGSVPNSFPNVPVECEDVEDSIFFARTFDGVVAWGLFFLLDEEVQRRMIKKVAGVLQSRWQIALHGSEGKRFVARCHDRAIAILPGLRGIPKSAGGQRHVVGW